MTTPSGDDPKQGLRDKIKALHVVDNLNGELVDYVVQLPDSQVDAVLALIEQTLHDCLPEKRALSKRTQGIQDYVNPESTIIDQYNGGFNAAIDVAQANFKRRIG